MQRPAGRARHCLRNTIFSEHPLREATSYSERAAQQLHIPRGWVILTVALACWGLVSLIALVLYCVFLLPNGFLIAGALIGAAVIYSLWVLVARRFFPSGEAPRDDSEDR
jgi:hypothetical protein